MNQVIFFYYKSKNSCHCGAIKLKLTENKERCLTGKFLSIFFIYYLEFSNFSTLVTKLVAESSLEARDYDALILIYTPEQQIKSAPLQKAVTAALQYDPSLKSEIAILPLPELPAGRLVYAPTGSLDPDYDDVRCLKTSACKAITRALKAGIRRPLLVLGENPNFENGELVTILGALEALYTVSCCCIHKYILERGRILCVICGYIAKSNWKT